jgi:hypothetical protein
MHPTQIQNPPHYVLFGCVFLEILSLEIFASGLVHHVWDAFVIGVYAYAAARMSGQRFAPWILVSLGGTAWLLDLLAVPWEWFDLESLLWALTHVYLAFIVGRLMFMVKEITILEIIDAVTLYIIIGIVFANLYGMVLWHTPDALAYSGLAEGERVSYDLVLYYSFITQTTVGYGDIAPTHPTTRVMSVVQAIVGVMYTAILIARFVSIHAASQPDRSSSNDRPDT